MCCCTQCESKSKLAPAANETQKSRSPDPFSETQRPILVTQQSLFVLSLRKSSKWGRSLTFLIKFDSSKSILLGRSDSSLLCAAHTTLLSVCSVISVSAGHVSAPVLWWVGQSCRSLFWDLRRRTPGTQVW